MEEHVLFRVVESKTVSFKSCGEIRRNVYLCTLFQWTKLAKQPMVKFMGHTISFLVFLLLVILSSTENFGRESSKITLESNYYAIALNYQTYRYK